MGTYYIIIYYNADKLKPYEVGTYTMYVIIPNLVVRSYGIFLLYNNYSSSGRKYYKFGFEPVQSLFLF